LRQRQAAAWRAETARNGSDSIADRWQITCEVGIRAMEILRDMPLERIHSRKLRSFEETAFL